MGESQRERGSFFESLHPGHQDYQVQAHTQVICEPRTYQPVDSQSHQPVESQSYQPFEPPPTRQGHEPMSPPRTPRDVSYPASPTSPSFETPPSSPVHNPEAYTNGPEPETSQNFETPTIPRRSTQVSRPPEKLAYDKDFKVIMKPVVNPA